MLEEQVAVITPIMEEELTTSACHQIHSTVSQRSAGTFLCMCMEVADNMDFT